MAVDLFLEFKKPRIKENSYLTIENRLRKSNYFDNLLVSEITPIQVSTFQNELIKKYEPRTIKNINICFKMVFTWCMRYKGLASNPFDKVDRLKLETDKRMDIFYDDGQLLMRSDKEKGEITIYFENGNPLLVIVGTTTSILYNENKEVLSRMENGIRLDDDITFKNLEDGSFELIKNNKVIGKISADGTPTYLYSTGETLMKLDNSIYKTLFKNGNTFFERDGNISRFYYKDGKLLYESNNGEWKFFDRDGKEIMSNFDNITDIKKID